ncbi:hypothetical protein TrVE_jg11427 [Triparma verrucosa]|uniref:Uncharacterized protein n=1 Tax=Triparma verrucosa TaxID=1606542 RepID=A0A9W7FB82_9STRA|nr:hypothetical protein TrVE_jg11427 [Triparma verrucosa]
MTLVVSLLSMALVALFVSPSSKSAGDQVLKWHDELYNDTVRCDFTFNGTMESSGALGSRTIVHLPGQRIKSWAPGLEANVTGVHHVIPVPLYPIIWMIFRWFAGVSSVFHALPWKVARESLWYAVLLFILDGVGSYFMTVKDQNDQIESEREGLEYSGAYYLYTQLSNLLSPVIYCLLLGFKLKDHSIWKRMLGLGFARGCVSYCLYEGTMAYNRADNFIERMLIRTLGFMLLKAVAIHLEAWFIMGFKDARDDTRIISGCFVILICGVIGRMTSIGAGTGETVFIEIILIFMELFELDDYIRGETVVQSYTRGAADIYNIIFCGGRGKKANAITPDSPDQFAAREEMSSAKRAFFGDAIIVYGVGEATGVIVGSAFALVNNVNMSEPGGEPYSVSTILTNLAIVLLCEVFLADFAVAAWSTVKNRDQYMINKILPKVEAGKTPVDLTIVWSNREPRHKLRFLVLVCCCALCASFFGVGIYTSSACIVRRGVEFGDEWIFSACPSDSLCAMPIENNN